MPLSSCSPRSSNSSPEPATRSRTVRDDQHLARPPARRPARRCGRRSRASPSSRPLDLAGVHAGPDLEAERPDRVADRRGAADRPRRAVEEREEAVAGGVDLPPRKRASSRRTSGRAVEQVAPALVAELGGALGRADDVGEQDGREHAVGLARRRAPVRNSSISSTTRRSSTQRKWSSPGSSTKRAPGMCSAM